MAEKNLASMLDQLSERAADLNAASDSVNTILAAVERRIVDANVGIETWLQRPISASDRDGSLLGNSTVTTRVIGFAKLDGKWCLATKQLEHVSGFFEGDQSCPFTETFKVDDPIPLLRASREVRIAALEGLPGLIEQVTLAADQYIQHMNDVKHLV